MIKVLKLLTLTLLFITVFMACSKSKYENRIWSEDNPPAYDWPDGQKYYYGGDKKIYIDEVPNKFVLRFDDKYRSAIQKSLQKNARILDIELDDFNKIFTFTTTENTALKSLMEDFKKQSGIKSINPMYVYDNIYDKLEMSVTDEIIVQFKDNVSQNYEMHKKYQVEVKEHPYPGLFPQFHQIISVPLGADILGIANVYQESGLVIYSQPNFISKIELAESLIQ